MSNNVGIVISRDDGHYYSTVLPEKTFDYMVSAFFENEKRKNRGVELIYSVKVPEENSGFIAGHARLLIKGANSGAEIDFKGELEKILNGKT